MSFDPGASSRVLPFSERAFYLSELRDCTIAIAGCGSELQNRAALEPVLKDLEANRTRVVLISDRAEALEPLLEIDVLKADELATLPGRAWRQLGRSLRIGVAIEPGAGFGAACGAVVLALGIRKLVWADPAGGLVRKGGERDSFVNVEALRACIGGDQQRSESREILVEIEAMLSAGVSAVNLCTVAGVADELFTYNGSGTLFTSRNYVDVRSLGLDDFDAAVDLIERGMTEGFLAPRSPEQIERVLASGFGVFIGGNHLAGVGTLLMYGSDRAAEIACLYTLTRFLGEGVGGHLVRFAAETAKRDGRSYLFACTTSERVTAFFLRNGFRCVESDTLPIEKWSDYDPKRRADLRCLRRDL
jgi:N-acetylglutamate synthase-like GNAT family acetyltransferase